MQGYGPVPLEYRGALAAFYTGVFRLGRRYHLLATRANGQPAFGTYPPGPGGVWSGAGLLVLGVAGDRIGALTGLGGELPPRFGPPLSPAGSGPGNVTGSR